jgi:hypothetical protein
MSATEVTVSYGNVQFAMKSQSKATYEVNGCFRNQLLLWSANNMGVIGCYSKSMVAMESQWLLWE